MKTPATPSSWLFLTFLLLTAYCLGTTVVNEVLEYQRLSDVGSYLSASDLAAWNIATPDHFAWLLPVSMVLLTAVSVALLRFLPAPVPRAALWAVLGCQVVLWGIAGAVRYLAPEMGNALATADWLRKLAWLLQAVLTVYMAYRAYSTAPRTLGRPVPAGRKMPALG